MESSKWQSCIEIKVLAPLEAVWKITSDYYELQKWFPGMKSCEKVEGAPNQGVGSVRYCTTPSPTDPQGSDCFAKEELISFDDANHSYTYRITDTNLPGFNGYKSTFQVCKTEEEGNCLLKWQFEINPIAGHSKEEIEASLSSILAGMAKNLEQLASSQ